MVSRIQRGVMMAFIDVLAICLSLQMVLASVQRIERLPYRQREVPKGWNQSELFAALPNSTDDGAMAVLIWESIDYKGVLPRLERCLVMKRLTKASARGETFVLAYMDFEHVEPMQKWRARPTFPYDERTRQFLRIEGFAFFDSCPTDAEIRDFLKVRRWDSETKPGKAKLIRARGERPEPVEYSPRLLDGGVCMKAWKELIGRGPPLGTFHELKERGN